MGYRLYGWKLTGSMAIEAALAEAGAAFELVPVNVRAREHHADAFRAVNPRQQLPALDLCLVQHLLHLLPHHRTRMIPSRPQAPCTASPALAFLPSIGQRHGALARQSVTRWFATLD